MGAMAMKDSEILSTLLTSFISDEVRPRTATPVMLLDGCDVGVILRSVVLVQVCLALGCALLYPDFATWVGQWAFATGVALPATLLWLLLSCRVGPWIQRRKHWEQGLLIASLGGGCGAAAAWAMQWLVLMSGQSVLVVAAIAFWLALVLWYMHAWRTRAKWPADTEAQLAGLQARIRPHFLFNTLNSAIALVRAEPSRAEQLLEDLSDLFRQALADQSATVLLGQEIDLARRYLSIEQIRFGARLQLSWDLDARADMARVPPLLLQPLVENAITHGVEPSVDGAWVEVSTHIRGGAVVLKVRNAVPAGPGLPGHGIALRNVEERLRLLHDVQAHFAYRLRDGVFEVRLEFPL